MIIQHFITLIREVNGTPPSKITSGNCREKFTRFYLDGVALHMTWGFMFMSQLIVFQFDERDFDTEGPALY